ncbi:MAG: TrpB-like pyridoxal phosphate-dependent enzyme [Thermoguttaceae bacterium]
MSFRRLIIGESELPAAWYNVLADLPEALPPALDPATLRPSRRADLARLFPQALIEQGDAAARWIDIPDEVRRAYALWRPTPLLRATGLERELRTPARIYFKDESHSPPGSHKLNTAVPQAYYAREEGVARLTTETGAGQWGCSLAIACSLFDLQCRVYMVRLTCRSRPYRQTMIRLWGGDVIPSPSEETEVGRRILAADPDCPGSIGIAISEAMEAASSAPDARYAMGSVLNHVLLHQTVIGLEVEKQLAMAGDEPDVLIGCAGGGSNFAGLIFPYVPHKLRGKAIRFLAAEPQACPTLTRGEYRYDSTDAGQLGPLVKMYTLGHEFVPPEIRACGLRYHGMAPTVSLLAKLGLVEAVAYREDECFEAARMFAAAEGTIPALESAYAIRAAVNEAVRCRETSKESCIVCTLSGHGLCELASWSVDRNCTPQRSCTQEEFPHGR